MGNRAKSFKELTLNQINDLYEFKVTKGDIEMRGSG